MWNELQECSAVSDSLQPLGLQHARLLRPWYFLFLFLQASLEAQMVKNLPAMWETRVWSLDWGDPLEKGKATHLSILVWWIPCTPAIHFTFLLRFSSQHISSPGIVLLCLSYKLCEGRAFVFFYCRSPGLEKYPTHSRCWERICWTNVLLVDLDFQFYHLLLALSLVICVTFSVLFRVQVFSLKEWPFNSMEVRSTNLSGG